jgi:protein-tyrosine-phosphatase
MESYTIEFICSGNNGRSPMANAIATYHIVRMGLDGKIKAISSGIKASPKDQANFDYQRTQNLLNHAADENLAPRQKIDEKRFNEETPYREMYVQKAKQALGFFKEIDAAFSNAALFQASIKYLAPEERRIATAPKSETTLVLGMEEKHVTGAKKIYDSASLTPEITTLSIYSGNPGMQFPDLFGKFKPDGYYKMRDTMFRIMPSALERFISEHNISRN